jgi:hypothetical protein
MPMDNSELIDLERRFWTSGPEFYREHLAEDCIMVFPGVGILSRDAVLSEIGTASRWNGVLMTDVRVVPLHDAVIVAYAAVARRNGVDAPYLALVSSAYIKQDGAWKLTFHQQSPQAAS